MWLHTSKALFRASLPKSSPLLFSLPSSSSFSNSSSSLLFSSLTFSSPTLQQQSFLPPSLSLSPPPPLSLFSTSSPLFSDKKQKRKTERKQIRQSKKRREREEERKHFPPTSEFSALLFGENGEDVSKLNRDSYNQQVLSPLLRTCKSRGDVLLLHSKLLDDGIELSPRNLTHFIQLAAINNEMDLLWEYYQKARHLEMELSDKTMRLIFASLTRQKNLHRSTKVWKRMARNGILPSPTSLQKFQTLCESKAKPNVQAKFKRYQKNPLSFIDPFPFTITSSWNGVNFGEEIDLFSNNNNNTITMDNMDNMHITNTNNTTTTTNNTINMEDFSSDSEDDLPGLFDLDLKKRGIGAEGGGEEEMEEGWEEELEGNDDFPMGGDGEDKIHIAFSSVGGGGEGEGEGEGEGGWGIREAPDLKMKVFGNTLMSLPPSFPPGVVWGLWKYEVVRVIFVGEKGEMSEIQIGPYGHYNLLQFDVNGEIVSRDHELALQTNQSKECGFWTGEVTLPRALLPHFITKMNIFYSHPFFGSVGEGEREGEEREREREEKEYPSDPREEFCYAWKSLANLSPDLHQSQMYPNIPPLLRSLFNFGRKPSQIPPQKS